MIYRPGAPGGFGTLLVITGADGAATPRADGSGLEWLQLATLRDEGARVFHIETAQLSAAGPDGVVRGRVLQRRGVCIAGVSGGGVRRTRVVRRSRTRVCASQNGPCGFVPQEPPWVVRRAERSRAAADGTNAIELRNHIRLHGTPLILVSNAVRVQEKPCFIGSWLVGC